MENNRKKDLLVSSFLVMFIIHSNQVGVGILGFPRYITQYTEQDAWIVVIITGLIFHVFVWMMYVILGDDNEDIIDLHKKWFGSWIGGFLNILFMLYMLLGAVIVLRTSIEVIQAWMFPELQTWIPAIMYLLLTYYVLAGGFRTVVGVSFFGVILPIWLITTAVSPAKFSSFTNLLPVFDHSLKEFAMGIKQMTLSYLGAEILLFAYPFLKNPKKSRIWAHLGIMGTTVIYLIVMVISIAFYSDEQLQQTIWSTLVSWKMVELPFVERFEYIGITFWCFVIFPNLCLYIWAATRIGKKTLHIKQKHFSIVLLFLVFLACVMIATREQIDMLNTVTASIGTYFFYIYVPIIFLYSVIRRRVTR
ncbi:GerAB/ArcD/ProY family transporter [Alkalihalobacillus sp. CinArs1]|uniref:GerAB/ArcD/ProY family transporter n=1 Tax=Alkalihalobacillus sp. CinArs1 TaxID=2995314 RepID=UPI0022DD64A3|nr:GerAB/ArcD/ProY family transporter [Alkalihalobacillus sp. CinArs1]